MTAAKQNDMLVCHRLFLSSASRLRNQYRFISHTSEPYDIDHRTTFISLKTSGTQKDEINPVDEFLHANVCLLGDSLGRTIARDLGESFLEQIEKLNGNHHHLEPYDDIKASNGIVGGSSEDSCYGSNDLSRSSSSAHGVARPLLTSQHRSSSLSSTSVDYSIPVQRHPSSSFSNNNKLAATVVVDIHQSMTNTDDHIQQQPHQLKTFHSPAASSSSSSHYNLKRTVQSITRRPIADLQSTYLTYDSVDAPPPPPPPSTMIYPNNLSTTSSSAGSSTSREYSI